jgi:hypothetical protein
MKDLTDVKDMEAESSTAPAPDETAKETAAESAASSPATDESKGDEPISVVREVVEAQRKKEELPKETASSAEGEEDADDKAGEKDSKKAPDDENFSDVPFHKHPRFQQLLRGYKTALPDAQRYRNIEKFLDNSGLSAEEGANALTIFGLAKSDPAQAWAKIKPWVAQLVRAAGEVVPEDLQKRVQAGEITKEVATELARTRAEVESAKTRQTFEQRQAERQAIVDRETAIYNAAAEWESQRRQRDPNFDAKQADLAREIAYLHATEGKPTDPDGVRKQLQTAYKAVNERIAATVPINPSQPRKPAMRPVNGGQATGTTHAKLESTADVVKSVLAQRAH